MKIIYNKQFFYEFKNGMLYAIKTGFYETISSQWVNDWHLILSNNDTISSDNYNYIQH